MFKRIALSFGLAVGLLASGGAITTDTAQARYYEESLGIWIDERKPEHNRRIDRRKPPSKFNRRNVIIRTDEAPGTIIVHTDKKFLYYVTAQNRAVRYGVGVGRDGFGWNGTVAIKRKEEWPVWIPPREMIAREREKGRDLPERMEGGPNNPLGARAMYLYKGKQDTLFRIHGTNQPWSIGLNLSSGCFRMRNKDVEDLYQRADIGTKVIVIGPGEDHRKYYSSFGLGSLFGG